LRYSSQADASWLWQVAPIERPQALWRGARRAVLVRLCLPIAGATTLLLCLFAPPLHALAHMSVVAAAGLVIAAIGNLSLRELPFSTPRQAAVRNRLVSVLSSVYLFGGGLGVAHAYLAWRAPSPIIPCYALGLTGVALALFRLGDRRFAHRFAAEEPG
jgi:hypothetical protein